MDIVRRFVEPCTKLDRRLRATLSLAVTALVMGGRLTVTALGRHLQGRTTPKHNIKRADRLIGNPRLRADLRSLQRRVALLLCRRVPRPTVLIDWTDVGHKLQALVASVPISGRSIPIVWEVHPQSRYGNRRVHKQFLGRIASVLPDDCVPIIVADAGFQAPFLRDVAKRGWGFVVRVRNSTRRFGPDRTPLRELLAKAGGEPTDLGEWVLRPDDLEPRLVLAPRREPKRRTTKLKKTKAYYRRRESEPWLLVTNLWNHQPREIVAIYSARMRIEEAIRDAKSHRYGWALSYSGTRDRHRTEVLLAIGMLATCVAVLAGMTAEAAGLQRQFQANTVKRRTLSLQSLGRAALVHADLSSIHWREPLAQLRDGLRGLASDRPNGSSWARWLELNERLGTDPFSSAAYMLTRA